MAAAELTTYNLSYADWAKRVDPTGKIDAIVELLNKTNPITEDAIVLEANGPTSHRTTVRTGIPQGTWRLLYQGVQPTLSRTVQVQDAIGMLEAYSEIDKSLADLNGNSDEFRLSEAKAFVEGMTQQFVQTLFYGTTSEPGKFVGIAPRYSVASTNPDNSGYNVISAGGSGNDNTSIYFLQWGSDCMHLIFPKGQTAGLQHQNLGEQTVLDANSGRYQAYRDHWKWDVGCTLRDWRSCARVSNIDVSDLSGASAADIVTYMIRAFYRIPNPNQGKMIIYCSRTLATWLHIQAMTGGTLATGGANKGRNIQLGIGEYAGRPITTFMGYPIRVCDGIIDTETATT